MRSDVHFNVIFACFYCQKQAEKFGLFERFVRYMNCTMICIFFLGVFSLSLSLFPLSFTFPQTFSSFFLFSGHSFFVVLEFSLRPSFSYLVLSEFFLFFSYSQNSFCFFFVFLFLCFHCLEQNSKLKLYCSEPRTNRRRKKE